MIKTIIVQIYKNFFNLYKNFIFFEWTIDNEKFRNFAASFITI